MKPERISEIAEKCSDAATDRNLEIFDIENAIRQALAEERAEIIKYIDNLPCRNANDTKWLLDSIVNNIKEASDERRAQKRDSQSLFLW